MAPLALMDETQWKGNDITEVTSLKGMLESRTCSSPYSAGAVHVPYRNALHCQQAPDNGANQAGADTVSPDKPFPFINGLSSVVK